MWTHSTNMVFTHLFISLFNMPNSNRYNILSISIYPFSISIFSWMSISISIFSRMPIAISIILGMTRSISIPIYSKFHYWYRFFKESSHSYWYFSKCRYIDNWYFKSIFISLYMSSISFDINIKSVGKYAMVI